MSRGMTIADFVQKVFYSIYKTRLDFSYSNTDAAYHADTDKFKEIVMEGNFVLEELQKEQDWNWLRNRLGLGVAETLDGGLIQEFHIPSEVYKICMGYGDAVRLHNPTNPNYFIEIPFTQARSGSTVPTSMFDEYANINVADNRLRAFQVGHLITFNRPFNGAEAGGNLETDVIRYLEPLHICDENCVQPCPQTYEDLVFTEIPDPLYMVIKTASQRAEGDPGTPDRVLSLEEDAKRLLSTMRTNDSAKTFPDSYTTIELGFMRVL